MKRNWAIAIAFLLAGCGEASLPAASDTTTTNAAPAVVTDAGSDAGAASPIEVIDPNGALCDAFRETWPVVNGAWASTNRWQSTGAEPTVTPGEGSFASNAPGCLVHALAPNCSYTLSLAVTLPPITPPDSVTFLTVASATPDGTLTFTWAEDAGGKLAINAQLGNAALLNMEDYVAGTSIPITITIATDGGLTLSVGPDSLGGSLYSNDGNATFQQMRALDIGVCAGQTAAAGAVTFSTIAVGTQ